MAVLLQVEQHLSFEVHRVLVPLEAAALLVDVDAAQLDQALQT